MKIRELIQELRDLLDEHGDIDVKVESESGYYNCPLTTADFDASENEIAIRWLNI